MFSMLKPNGSAGWAGLMQMLRTRMENIWEPLRMATGSTFSPIILSEETRDIQAVPDILAVLDTRDRQDMIRRPQAPKMQSSDSLSLRPI